jgi:hypothetical protein
MAGGASANTLKFKETLPGSCPPAGAGVRAYEGVWRFVSSNPVTDQDFASHHAQGKTPPPTVSACRWASSSLFLTKEAAYKHLPKPRKRFKYIAKVQITEQCGVSVLVRTHIDFWRFDTFKPIVLAIEGL